MAIISRSDRRQSGWSSWAGARDSSRDSGALHTWSDSPEGWEGNPDLCSPDRDFPTVVNEFCLPVKVSPCHSLFAASLNLATSQPGHRVFACLLIVPEGLGSESPWQWWPRGVRILLWNFQSISSTFTLWKDQISVLFGMRPLPSRWRPFEHFSTKVGSPDIDPVYSTLCPSITSTCSTSKFHFNTFQYSIEGAVMLDAITYGQDCTLEERTSINGVNACSHYVCATQCCWKR